MLITLDKTISETNGEAIIRLTKGSIKIKVMIKTIKESTSPMICITVGLFSNIEKVNPLKILSENINKYL